MSTDNYNASRVLVGGNKQGNIWNELRNLRRDGPPPTLQKAVVIDVICDLSLVTDEIKENIGLSVNNPELIDMMPVNTIIARLISDDMGNLGSGNTLLFPFFSSHLMMPVQPGEVVHVVYPDYTGKGMRLGYWMSRIHGYRINEDPNYTHHDRQYDEENDPAQISTSEQNLDSNETHVPGFPNGLPQHPTLKPEVDYKEPFEIIMENAIASRMRTPEPVPRWNKRPGEFIIQGSNNALICLGEDRAGSALYNEEDEVRGFSGTVDIVAGRGRYVGDDSSIDPEDTAPRVIKNSREELETDKTPFRSSDSTGSRKSDNIIEGDPDYINDAARLYLSMQTNGDRKFGIEELNFPEGILPIVQPEGEDGSNLNRSYGILKADHIRTIARRNKDKNIEGTVLILREGDSEDEEDLGFIYIDKNGIQIDAKKIYLGRASIQDPNENDPDFNGEESKYEPYILWSKYKATVLNLQDQIENLREEHKTAINSLRNEVSNLVSVMTESLANNICSPYSPHPGIMTLLAKLPQAQGNIQASTESHLQKAESKLDELRKSNEKENVDKINHSQKIYGEPN